MPEIAIGDGNVNDYDDIDDEELFEQEEFLQEYGDDDDDFEEEGEDFFNEEAVVDDADADEIDGVEEDFDDNLEVLLEEMALEGEVGEREQQRRYEASREFLHLNGDQRVVVLRDAEREVYAMEQEVVAMRMELEHAERVLRERQAAVGHMKNMLVMDASQIQGYLKGRKEGSGGEGKKNDGEEEIREKLSWKNVRKGTPMEKEGEEFKVQEKSGRVEKVFGDYSVGDVVSSSSSSSSKSSTTERVMSGEATDRIVLQVNANQLQEVDLSYRQLDDQVLIELSEALMLCSSVQTLVMEGVQMSDVGFGYLIAGITENGSLRTLDMTGFQFSDEQWTLFAEMFVSNNCLEEIVVDRCGYGKGEKGRWGEGEGREGEVGRWG
eukprot:TRINITY_DN5626_c2_g1_i1.p1 TRINITY_DN5626_c2_g1~~TRINITY_DN5626_c2_g1_i1.p1  ORF type:complete len:380 (+),score=149.52 TRINITY_DN5626_c2_g1_i1:164-1303(+)